ncbi:MAG TPA: VTT domain-containing protein [Sphingomonadaceae bacterium]|nr:VTT domain-containing protein [Sphingomonadaceae bacterium]
MDPSIQLLLMFALLVGVNLMPAFGPPTWAIIVFYSLNSDLHPIEIILTGALAAAIGRFSLAWIFRLLGHRLPRKFRDNLAAARELFERNRRNGIIALTLFALSPVPSAQLFEAAGLAGVRLLQFTIAFFLGRIVSYSIYTYTAQGIRHSALGDIFAEGLSSPLGITLQLIMIAGLVALAKIDWAKLLEKANGSKPGE